MLLLLSTYLKQKGSKTVAFTKKTSKFWKFDKKEEAVKKLSFLKNPDTYEIVQNRENGKIAKGWVLRKKAVK